MALGAEGFTVLAVLEARDVASKIYEKVQESVERFSGAMKGAADTASAAGAKIDESILQTASGADALDVATAKVNAAQTKAATATKAQADAERDLIAAQEQAAAAADGDAAATDKLEAAAARLAETQKVAQKATTALKSAQTEQTAISDLQAGAADKAATSNSTAGSKLSSMASSVGKVGVGLDIAGGLMVKSAADFQSSTSVLTTSGGETAAELGKARDGILSLSASTGTGTKELTSGLYMLGSAGFDVAHGGLQALQSAAQGAKAENADLGTVSNALSTILTDYGIKVANNAQGQQASNAVMDQMIAVVQNGKTTTEALAASLSAVLPVASSAKLGFDQIGGALATMTAQGMSAQQASQDLAHTIGALQSPNAVAVKEMQAMGLNANDVSKNLGKQGLTGTLATLTQAITAHMGPAGLVVQNAFASSTAAAKDANAMISTMPAGLQKLAQAYMSGSVTSKQWTADLKGLPPIQAKLMTQFAGVADKTHTFNSLLAAGSPAAQTYNGALSKMMGGQTGLTTALMLTGSHLTTFQGNVKTVADAAKGAGSSVDGWKQIQGNFNQKLAEAKQSVEAMGITIGTALLPAVTKIADAVLKVVTPVLHWLQAHQQLAAIIFGSLAGFASLVGMVNLAAKGFGAVSKSFGIVSAGFGRARDAIGWVANGVAKIPGLVSSAWSGISSAASTMASWASSAASWVGNAASVAAGWVKSGVQAVLAAGKFLILKGAQLASAAASGVATAAQWAFNAAMDASPITLVVLAILALVAIFVVLWVKCAWFRDFWKALWKDIESAAKVVFSALKTAFSDVVGFYVMQFRIMVDVAEAVWHALVATFDAIKNTITTVIGDVVDWVKAHWQLLIEIFTGPIGIITGLVIKFSSDLKKWFQDGVRGVETAVSWFTSLPGKFLKWMSDIGSDVLKGIDDVVRFFASLPGKITSGIGSVGSLLLQKGKDIVNGLWSGIQNIWRTVTSFFTGIGGTVEGWLSGAGSWLYNIGKSILDGLLNGAKSAVGDVKNFFTGIAGDIVSWKGPPSYDKVMLTGNGQLIMKGLITGLDSQVGALQNHVGAITLGIKTGFAGGGSGVHVPTIAASPTAGTGGSVTMHFDLRGATVTSQQAAKQLVDQIGGVVAKQMFAQAGHKLGTL